jgi:carbon monoxide dehydrogenase subunit G
MKNFESKRVTLKASSEKVFVFLSDMSNLGRFMPEQITNWQATVDTCSFTIQNMTTLSMRISERVPFERIDVTSEGKTPFNFTLHLMLYPQTDHQSEACFILKADLNPVFSMMASKPLQNLVDLMADNLNKYYSL